MKNISFLRVLKYLLRRMTSRYHPLTLYIAMEEKKHLVTSNSFVSADLSLECPTGDRHFPIRFSLGFFYFSFFFWGR
jgi:hypothetical protein